jgi:hypothetical protein
MGVDVHLKTYQATPKVANLAVATKKADEVYTVAEDLKALLKALPSESSNLSADKLKRIEGQVKMPVKSLMTFTMPQKTASMMSPRRSLR